MSDMRAEFMVQLQQFVESMSNHGIYKASHADLCSLERKMYWFRHNYVKGIQVH